MIISNPRVLTLTIRNVVDGRTASFTSVYVRQRETTFDYPTCTHVLDHATKRSVHVMQARFAFATTCPHTR